jgi:hypothetical protein
MHSPSGACSATTCTRMRKEANKKTLARLVALKVGQVAGLVKGNVVDDGGAVDVGAGAADDEVLGEAQAQLGSALQIALHPDAPVNLRLENRPVAVEEHRDALNQVHKDLVLSSMSKKEEKNRTKLFAFEAALALGSHAIGLLVLLLARVLPNEVTLEMTLPSIPLPGVASVSTGLLNTNA